MLKLHFIDGKELRIAARHVVAIWAANPESGGGSFIQTTSDETTHDAYPWHVRETPDEIAAMPQWHFMDGRA